MYCTNCGAKLKDGANFCTECGSKVKKSQVKLEKENFDHKDYSQNKKVIENEKIEKDYNSYKKEDKDSSEIINKGKYSQFFAGKKASKLNPDNVIKKENEDNKKDLKSKKFSKENTNTEKLELNKDDKAKKDTNKILDKNLQGQKIEKTYTKDTSFSIDEKTFKPKNKVQKEPDTLEDDSYTKKLDLSNLKEKTENTSSEESKNKSLNNLSNENKESKDYKNSLKTKTNKKITNPNGLVKIVSYVGLAFMAIFVFVYVIDLFSILKSIIGGIF